MEGSTTGTDTSPKIRPSGRTAQETASWVAQSR